MPPKGAENRNGPKPEVKSLEPAASDAGIANAATKASGGEVNHSFAKLRISESSRKLEAATTREPPRSSPAEVRLDEEKTHLSVSSTKAPSLDDKSVASTTTFALDEKESIRPDDSASVQAAEDDDSNSGRGSGDPSSRFGSDNGVKPFQYQYHEISERASATGAHRPLPFPRRLMMGTAEDARRMGAPPPLVGHPVPASTENAAGAHVVPPMPAASSSPDEKLIDALESHRDRMFLLQLEQQFINFIEDPK